MEDKVALYDELVKLCPRFERKGKNNPYTSANGHMFSFINKDGEFGIRFSKEVQEKYIKELGTGYFIGSNYEPSNNCITQGTSISCKEIPRKQL